MDSDLKILLQQSLTVRLYENVLGHSLVLPEILTS